MRPSGCLQFDSAKRMPNKQRSNNNQLLDVQPISPLPRGGGLGWGQQTPRSATKPLRLFTDTFVATLYVYLLGISFGVCRYAMFIPALTPTPLSCCASNTCRYASNACPTGRGAYPLKCKQPLAHPLHTAYRKQIPKYAPAPYGIKTH